MMNYGGPKKALPTRLKNQDIFSFLVFPLQNETLVAENQAPKDTPPLQ